MLHIEEDDIKLQHRNCVLAEIRCCFQKLHKVEAISLYLHLSSGVVKLDSYKIVNSNQTGNVTHYRKTAQLEYSV